MSPVSRFSSSTLSRLGLILVMSLGVFALIVVRLIDLQLIRGDNFLRLSDDNRYFKLKIPPERGVFFDRFDQPLVYNQQTYAQAQDSNAIWSAQTPIPRSQALRLMATQSAQVRFGTQRNYLFAESLSHALGYVGAVSSQDLINDASLRVSDVIGKMGLEKKYDQQLRGRAGSEVYEINALGQRQRLVQHTPSQSGQNLHTTFDPYLSEVVRLALGDENGVGIIMDADTGQILSLVSNPGFDANLLSSGQVDPVLEKQRQEALRVLLNDPRQVFFNRALSGVYPPGSVFKPITAIAGLENEDIDAQTTVLDEGILKVGEYEYANWYFTQFGRTEGEIGLQRALARSNDIYFYKVAEWLGPQKLAEFARLFGLGKMTGVQLGGEAIGVVPDPAWKEQVIGEPWYLGNTFHMGIGQGDLMVTPIQIAQMTQALANQGKLCQPTLIAGEKPDCSELSLKPENLELVLSGLIDACSAGGTAYPFFEHNQSRIKPDLPAMQQLKNGVVACKTGTAEFGGSDERGYRATHGWLTAMVGTAEIKKLARQDQIDQVLATEQEDKSKEINNDTNNENDEEELQANHDQWLDLIAEHDFPETLVITVLIESDEDHLYKEGSKDAGPVVKAVVDWMIEGKTPELLDL
jgi:penicillin-binding protein 2